MRKILSVLLILSMLCAAAACAQGVTVSDAAGRTVTLDSPPRRIVSGYYITTSMLIALGLKDNLVGIEAKAQERNLYRLTAPELMTLPDTGTAKNFQLEACLSLAPDLVILPIKLKSAAEDLNGFDIKTVLVNPENAENLLDTIRMLGTLCGAAEQADVLISACDALQNELTNRLMTADKPSVYLAGNSSVLETAANSMYQTSLITLGGGRSVTDDLDGSTWVSISYEQLLNMNPDYIILSSDAVYTVQDVLDDPMLSYLSAVQSKRVFRLPGAVEAWDSPVPATMLGSLWIAKTLHPNLVTEELYLDSAVRFYETFYHFSPDRKQLK